MLRAQQRQADEQAAALLLNAAESHQRQLQLQNQWDRAALELERSRQAAFELQLGQEAELQTQMQHDAQQSLQQEAIELRRRAQEAAAQVYLQQQQQQQQQLKDFAAFSSSEQTRLQLELQRETQKRQADIEEQVKRWKQEQEAQLQQQQQLLQAKQLELETKVAATNPLPRKTTPHPSLIVHVPQFPVVAPVSPSRHGIAPFGLSSLTAASLTPVLTAASLTGNGSVTHGFASPMFRSPVGSVHGSQGPRTPVGAGPGSSGYTFQPGGWEDPIQHQAGGWDETSQYSRPRSGKSGGGRFIKPPGLDSPDPDYIQHFVFV